MRNNPTHCIYFNGIQNKKCRRGVEYKLLVWGPPGWPLKLPCIREAKKSCEWKELQTDCEEKDNRCTNSDIRMNILCAAIIP